MKKTTGNIYYVLRYLELIHHLQLLNFSFAINRWEWGINAITANTDVAENVVEVLTERVDGFCREICSLP